MALNVVSPVITKWTLATLLCWWTYYAYHLSAAGVRLCVHYIIYSIWSCVWSLCVCVLCFLFLYLSRLRTTTNTYLVIASLMVTIQLVWTHIPTHIDSGWISEPDWLTQCRSNSVLYVCFMYSERKFQAVIEKMKRKGEKDNCFDWATKSGLTILPADWTYFDSPQNRHTHTHTAKNRLTL